MKRIINYANKDVDYYVREGAQGTLEVILGDPSIRILGDYRELEKNWVGVCADSVEEAVRVFREYRGV